MSKKGAVTLLFALVLAVAVGGQAFAAIEIKVGGAGTNTIDTQLAGAKNVVLTSFRVEEDGTGADAITSFTVVNPAGATGLGSELAKISIYRDVNGDQKLDAKDTLVAGATQPLTPASTVYTAGSAITLTPTNNEGLATAGSMNYLVVVDLSRADGGIVDKHTFGAVVGGATLNSGPIVAANPGDNVQAAKTLNIRATHLRFLTTGYNPQAAVGNNFLQTGDFLAAVDDFGNVDTDFNESVSFTSADFSTFDSTIDNLTASATGVPNVKVGVGSIAFPAGTGILQADTGGAAGEMLNISHTTSGAVTLIAVSSVSKIEGSVTVTNGAYPMGAPVVNLARGTEVYDVDHNGHIDHMTIFFDKPVEINGAVAADFTIGSGYPFIGAPAVNFDAGGAGIRNAGNYGVTVTLGESDAFDTNALPQLTYNASSKLRNPNDLTEATRYVQAVGSAQSVEVDKARPILISAVTKDSGFGTGTATNGILDGIVLTFSEPVRNITAGANLVEHATSYIGLAIPAAEGIAFNQGNGSSSANVHTIPVGETTINTGLTPVIKYNENWAAARITDYAKSALSTNAYNAFYASNTSFGVGDTDIQTTDGAPMVVHSVETLDENPLNGRIDRIRVTFSEPTATGIDIAGVDFYSAITAFASKGDANGVYKPNNVSGQGSSTLTFDIDEVTVAGVYDTEAAPSFRYDPNGIIPAAGLIPEKHANIADATGNPLGAYGPGGLSHAPTKDMAAPVIVKFVTNDAYTDTAYAGDSTFEAEGPNGRIDQITVIFSEKVQTGEGAQLGGTALNHAIETPFVINHPDGGIRTKMLTTAALGKPTWTDKDVNGDTSTEIAMPFQEVSFATPNLVNKGDTGVKPTLAYNPSGTTSYKIRDCAAEPNYLAQMNAGAVAATDGAKPFIVDGLGYGALAFTNILTQDSDENTMPAARTPNNNGSDGDGYIDAYVLKFSENVSVTSGTSDAFTVDLPGAGALTFSGANSVAAGSVVTVTGSNDKKSGPDTAVTPPISFNPDKQTIADGTGNKLVKFTDRVVTDGARPVIVGVNGDTAQANKLNFKFSEPIFAHDADGNNISFNATSVASSSLFGYDNLGAGPGSSGFTAAVVTQPSADVLQATLNANLTVVDIENDLVWVRTSTIFDDANGLYPALSDNVLKADVGGANLKFWIMDDVIAPWIVNMSTVDYNLNGKIDHIRVEFSEKIDDSTLKGFVSANAMSEDVSATWILSGYTGPARWNLFDGTENAGKQAAITAGKPAFSDNDTDDNILYLELDENLVPVNAVTGIGSTGFKPTVTWGAGSNAETLGDFRPNLLNTNADPDKTTPKATNGAVLDKVGPVIVGATISGKDITVLFSEPVKKIADVKYAEYFLVDGSSAKIWGISRPNSSSVVLTMKSDYGFSTSGATTVQFGTGLPTGDIDDLKDADGNLPGLAADAFMVYDRPADAMQARSSLWEAVSPALKTPYPAKNYTRGAFNVTNNVWIAFKEISDGTPAAQEAVTIKWTYSNVDSVDVYVSFNGGESYELVPGSRTAASAGQYVWTAKLGVTQVKVQSAAASGVNFATIVTPVYDGNVVGGSIGAPATLAISDVPNDNGGFVFANFMVSADNLTAVKSYVFEREMTVGEAVRWVQWAVVPAGAPAEDGTMTVIVPTITNDTAKWAVRASTSEGLLSGTAVAAKAAVPVAEVVYDGGVAKAAVVVVSAQSNVVEGASVDNIAPSAFTAVAADNPGAGAGILVSWVPPADHGIVGTYVLSGATNYIYGVEKYDIYRKTGTGEWTLVGTAPRGSTQFVDQVADGATVYNYMIKATDGTFTLEPPAQGNATAWNGSPDFNANGSVELGDLVLLGAMWNVKSTDANFVPMYDLNGDGSVGLGDLVLLGNAWSTSKVAKSAPAAGMAFDLNAEYNADNSIYYVTVNAQNAADVNGIAFSLKYDAEKYEFVSEAVNGLSSDINVIKADKGVVDIASFYGSEKFNGAVVLGFKAKGQIAEMNVEMVNAQVAINGEINAVSNSTVTLKAVPTVYSLSQNFPNPFNPTTTIEYSIPKAGLTSLDVYNIAGQKVRTLVNETQSASFYKVVWDGRNDNGESVATGMYFYKLVSGNYSKIVKMTLMK